MTIYSFSRKTMNTRENFWNVYCFGTYQMRDETAKDNGQTAAGISYDFIDTKQWAGFFFFEKSSIFPLYLSIFYHKPTLVTFTTNQCWISKTKLPNWPKSECKIVKIYNGTGSRNGKGFSATKKYGSKTTNHSQLAWPFELHVKQTQRNIACDWLIFSRFHAYYWMEFLVVFFS